MSDMLISVSPDYLYFKDKNPEKVSKYHKPYFLAFTNQNNIESARKRLIKKTKEDNSDIFSKIDKIGDIEEYRSFSDFSKKRKVFRVYTKKSYFVPEVSDKLFFNYGLYTGEHDIPYHQRALIDLSVDKDMWPFDSKKEKKTLNVLVYDIETTKYSEGNNDIPVDMIGWANFNVCFESSKDLSSEEFSFDILDCPDTWQGIEIKQVDSKKIDDEIDNLFNFCKEVMKADIISGHNILGFDNTQIYTRLRWILKRFGESLSKEKKDIFWNFLNKYSREDKSFHFGIRNKITQFYPSSLDTYLGVRKFYRNLNEYSLKAVAPFLGINIKDRIVLTPTQINIDDRTRKYNIQDVQEQLGVTLNLVQQVLPLSFTTGMPFDMLLSSGAVNMWDHMSLVRGYYQKKIMPPICRVMSTAKTLVKYYKGCNTKEKIVKQSIDKKDQLSKELARVVKYGSEMPEWMLDPYVIYNEHAKDKDEQLNYHFPGGMTIKPDKDANSHFIPWWYVVVADVGAMYPTILKAMNIGADTVRYAKSSETPDDWIWLKKIPREFFEKNDVKYRKVTEEDTYADKGYMIGVKIDEKPGVVNSSMTGIMNIISKVKKELVEVKKTDDKESINRLKMMYQSVKGARNAGSVDYSQRIILINPNGEYENIKIGEFVDKIIKMNGHKIQNINDTDFEVSEVLDGWKAVSINREGKVQLKKVKQAVRHKWSKKLVKITTKSGYTIVTPNHSIFTIKNGKITDIPAGEISDDTLLVHANKIPDVEKKIDIRLIDEIKSPGYYGYIDKDDLRFFNGLKEKLIKSNLKNNNSTSYLKIKLEKLRNIKIPDEKLKYILVGSNGRKSSKIKPIISVDKKLAEFLGYYISEGHTSKRTRNNNPFYYISISGADEEIHKRIKDLSNDIFGVPVYKIDRRGTPKGVIESTIHAKVINYFLENIMNCGNNSRDKKIPNQILSSPYSVKKSFFIAYMKGDGNYKKEMPSSVPLGRYTTNSKNLNEDMICLQRQFGMKTNTYFRPSEKTYNTRMIGYFKGKRKYLNDCFAIPAKKIEIIEPTSEYVYDISVEDNENFLDANGGILLHNTHGIISAPNVSGRQFNLWGAAAITTKGQVIMADSLNYLKNKGIRITYMDTDGIYLGCSKSMASIPDFARKLDINFSEKSKEWITKPDIAFSAIEECNSKWREELNYPDFELEPEEHDSMIFVKHKNYLIFDSKNKKIDMITKGNNFKGSDKANIARIVLKEIMMKVLKEIPVWSEEEEARKKVRELIGDKTRDIVSELDLSKVDIKDLTLVQSVQPAKRYKPNQDGSLSNFAKRAIALEKVLGEQIRNRAKFKFVVTKNPLPGISSPSKSGVKPIEYMYPVDLLKDKQQIDLDWYKEMVQNYIKGAFGLSDIAVTEQTGLDSWM